MLFDVNFFSSKVFQQAVLIAVGTILVLPLLWKKKQERIPGIPHVPSWVPFIGYGGSYFQALSKSSVQLRQKYGDVYTMSVFGKLWCKIHAKADIDEIIRFPEKRASLLKAYLQLAGPALPKAKIPRSGPLREVLDPFKTSGTTLIAHSVRSPNLQSWIPSIREVLQQRFEKLPKSGQVDLFDWCRELICAITVRMMLGSRVAEDEALLQRFVHLFHQADPESGFNSPIKSVLTIGEVSLLGERRIYTKVRELLYPLIDEEIEKCSQRTNNKSNQDSSALSSMVWSWYDGKLGRNKEAIIQARTRIANDLFNFTFAAFSNSFGMAAWVVFHVLQNTNDLGTILQKELEQATSCNSLEVLNLCPKLERAILEIGRLYTPGDFHRKLMEDWTLPSNGAIIPAGTIVLIPCLTSMRDPNVFQNPCELDITRFERGEHKNAGGMFIPFGAGSHPCAGKRFALLEIALLVSEAMQQFHMELVEGEDWGTDVFTNQCIQVPKHPPLDLSQAAFIWRPAGELKLKFEKK